jgi:hypothetical protein
LACAQPAMDPMELTNYSGGSTATFIQQRDPVACRIAKVTVLVT